MNNSNKSGDPADAIRTSIMKTADDMRAAARQADENAKKLGKEAEEISQFLIKTVTGFADRVAAHLQQCDEASKAFNQHREALANLPDMPAPAPQQIAGGSGDAGGIKADTRLRPSQYLGADRVDLSGSADRVDLSGTKDKPRTSIARVSDPNV